MYTLSKKITMLALIPLAFGALTLTGCATGENRTSTSTYKGPSDWSYVGRNASGDAFFVDYSTIRRNGALARVAQKQTWKRPEIFCGGKRPARSARFIGEFNCRTKQTRSLHSTVYSGPDLDGEVVAGRNASGPWRRVVPGTPSASMLKAICNQ